ncbi:Gp138 family membrane-puncturing spike protein, partial [Avibacterium paragallinarum]|uniref:Gp138 family membrane-puncturing spike protein n=1 Tax=Avibacterium paragallinarum TaxID=728 RepID=UPI002E131F27
MLLLRRLSNIADLICSFSERCIDGWWQSGNASEPLDHPFHDLSDAMFIPG